MHSTRSSCQKPPGYEGKPEHYRVLYFVFFVFLSRSVQCLIYNSYSSPSERGMCNDAENVPALKKGGTINDAF